MNKKLAKMMLVYYDPGRGPLQAGSTLEYTLKLRTELPEIFKKYNIQSIFDAGCNSCEWISTIIENLDYYGGDISSAVVADLHYRRPDLKILHHDVTTDQLPDVDLLFVKDVSIHLCHADKLNLVNNWMSSGIPWIMITHDKCSQPNLDIKYKAGFPWASVNWELPPWNFPNPTDIIYEDSYNNRCMALWHRSQLIPILEMLQD